MPERDRKSDEALLKEIRDRYTYGCDYWAPARRERQVDLRYLDGNPWEEADRKARADAGRPCVNDDELNQYVNQCVNNVRQNKKGVKIEPESEGADAKTAELRQNLVRGIEYKSQAAAIYVNAFQSEVEGSYGFCRITRRYLPGSFNQEIVVKPIANPDSVVYDPDCKEPDWSDAEWCFVVEPMPREEFKSRWPEAKQTDFSAEDCRNAPDWINEKTILTAEYWRIEKVTYTLYELEDGTVVRALPKGVKEKRSRQETEKKVVQYFTNGIEILDRLPQPGNEIPIPAFIGLERYVDDGDGPKRKLYSLVRLARDPQMGLAYLNSLEMEEAGLSPKTPYVGYAGQFETDATAWKTATKQPHAFLQVDPIPDAANGQVLPLPRREPFAPNFQQYELAKESKRRAVQAAMGITPLPTPAQRQNEKSGVALERIETAESIGSFHFVDGYHRAVTRAGRIIDSWIDSTYDTERDAMMRKADGTAFVGRLNTPEAYQDANGQMVHYPIAKGTHNVTISDAPSYESQRKEASDFLDTLVANLGKLPVAPPQAAKLLAIAIKMKQLGPYGDEMAGIIAPDNAAAAQQQMQQMAGLQQQLQLQNELVAQLQTELAKLQFEKQAKVLDNDYKLAIEKLRIEADVAKAEIATKAQVLNERIQFVEDVYKQLHGQAHDAAMQASEQAHAREQQEAAAAAAQSQAEAQPEQSGEQLPEAA